MPYSFGGVVFTRLSLNQQITTTLQHSPQFTSFSKNLRLCFRFIFCVFVLEIMCLNFFCVFFCVLVFLRFYFYFFRFFCVLMKMDAEAGEFHFHPYLVIYTIVHQNSK